MRTESDHLLFQHIPKNGGTTFNSILDIIFAEKTIFTFDVVNNNMKYFNSLTKEEIEKIYLLKGHFKFGIHKRFSGSFNYVTFLRNPTDRINSYYHYVISQPNHRLYHDIVDNEIAFYDFIKTFRHKDINNAQIRFISGIDDKEEFMLEKSIENIERFYPVVGILEKFDESLILFKKYFNWEIPNYEIKNKSKKGKSNISQSQIEAISELNAGDIKLYEYIQRRFKKQLNELFGADLKKEIELFRNTIDQPKTIVNHLKAVDLSLLKSFAFKIVFSIQDLQKSISDFSEDVISNKATSNELLITSKGLDPYFVINMDFISSKLYYIYLSIEVPNDTYTQLYYVEKEDDYFSEKKSCEVFSGKGKSKHLFSLDGTNIKEYLRIDPGTFDGVYRIEEFMIFELIN